MTTADLKIAATAICDAPPVWRLTAPNPGPKTLDGTHTYVVGWRDAYIIDPGPKLGSYQQDTLEWLAQRGYRCRGVLLTHGHPDHAPGAGVLGPALRVPIRAAANLDTSYFDVVPRIEPLTAGDRLEVDGDTLLTLATPGHTRDHLAFFLEIARIVFVGDTILGHGSTLIAPPEGNMVDYMRTLARLRALDAALIAPGHGPLVTDPRAKIDDYVAHREEREHQVLAALATEKLTVAGLVERLYHGIEPELAPLATASVTAQLEKLEVERRVRRDGDHYERGAGSC